MLNGQPPKLLSSPPLGIKIRLSIDALKLYSKFLSSYYKELWPQYKNNFFETYGLARQLKLRKRFLTGAHLGFLISKYLLEENGPIPEPVHALNGEIFGFWGISIIAMDHCIDRESPKQVYAKIFLERLLGIMHKKPVLLINETTDGDNLVEYSPNNSTLEIFSIILCSILRNKVDELYDIYNKMNRKDRLPEIQEEFYLRTRELLNGQWTSLEQFSIEDSHNWHWFLTDILNQKTLNFFLAPISLYCLSLQSSVRYACLKHSFLELNSAYLHWQLLDDLADTIPDTLSGMMTTPGFMLVSQGQLAAKLQPLAEALETAGMERNNNPRITASRILELVQSSYLLETSFHPGRDWGKIHPHVPQVSEKNKTSSALDEALVNAKAALANRAPEFKLSLQELCASRIKNKEEFIIEMRQGNKEKAIKILIESGVGLRIIAAVQDPVRMAHYRKSLQSVENHYLLSILELLNRLISRAYQRAWRIWVMPGGH